MSYEIPKPTVLVLTVKDGGVRSVASYITAAHVQKILGLFDGRAVIASVYSGTNKCFNVTPKMLDTAWEELDKEKYFWITEEDIPKLKERFCTENEYGHTLSCSFPNFCCKETPAEIELMIIKQQKELENVFTSDL